MRDGLLSGLAIFVAALGSLLWLNNEAVRNQGQMIRDSMDRLARGVAGMVDGDLHEEIVREGRMDDGKYDRALEPLINVHREVPEIAYLYTLIERDGQFHFVLDTAMRQEKLGFNRKMEGSPLLEAYSSDSPEEDAAEMDALHHGVSYVSKEPFTDEYGTFLTAVAPIHNSAGKVVGLVGLDISVADYLRRMKGLNDAAVVSIVIAALTGALIGLIVWGIRSKSMRHQVETLEVAAQKEEIEERDRKLIQALGQIIYRQSLNPDSITWAGDCAKILGIPPEAMAPTTADWIAQVHPSDRQLVQRRFFEAMAGLTFFDAEYRYRTFDGRYIWFHDRGVISRDQNGHPVELDGVLLNISERKMSDQKFRTVFESSADPHMLIDEDGVFDCNAATVEMLGVRDKSDVIRRPLERFLPDKQPDGRTADDCAHQLLPHAGAEKMQRFQLLMKPLSGEFVPVEVSNTNIMLDGRKVTLVVLHDLSAIKEAQSALLTSEQKYRELVENLDPIVFQTDACGLIVFLNPAWERMTGFPVKEALNHSMKDFLADKDFALLQSVLEKKTGLNGGPFTVEMRLRCKEGEWLWVEGYCHPRLDSEGAIIGSAGTLSNMTARKETERALIEAKEFAEAADRAKSEFLAVMSHEIRTPMNGVIGFTQLLDETDLSSQQREYVETIRNCGDSLLHLLNDVLDFSKIEFGNLQMEQQPFSLRQCASEVVSFYAPGAAAKGVSLELLYDEKLGDWILGDIVRFRQVLINLVGNAVKFTDSGKVQLKLSGEQVGDSEVRHLLKVEVSDTGIGITTEERSRLFKPFSQADSSTTRKYGGTGLGLAICWRLVTMMGGKLDVVSVPDHGSTFSFSIPVTETVPPESNETVILPTNDDPNLIILVVEDNKVNQKVLSHMLVGMGYKVDVAADGFECLAAVAEREYDLIFMDVQMPGLDGFETTARLRASGKSVWIAALTAAAMPDDRLKCQIAGMNDYMTKPFTKQQLITAIERCRLARLGRRVLS